MPPNRVPPAARPIPIEVYAHIFREISDPTVLHDLCMVSHTFRNEAERVLYRTVSLRPEYRCLFSWFKVIAETPRLANLVYSLTIPTGCWPERHLSSEIVELQTVGKQAFSSLSRLGELYLFFHPATYLVSQMLLGHRFRLRVFEDLSAADYYSPIDCMPFLSEQRDLQHWGANFDPEVQPLGADLVPSLTSAIIWFPMLELLAPRPIRALEIDDCSCLLSLSAGLKAFKRTLSSLVLRFRENVVEYQPPVVLRVLSEVVPDLRFLCLDVGTDVTRSLSQYLGGIDFLTALEGFPHLSILILTQDYSDCTCSRDQGLMLADAYMKANTSLSRVGFEAVGDEVTFACFTRVGKGPNAKGDSHGVAVFEGMDVVTPGSWKAL